MRHAKEEITMSHPLIKKYLKRFITAFTSFIIFRLILVNTNIVQKLLSFINLTLSEFYQMAFFYAGFLLAYAILEKIIELNK